MTGAAITILAARLALVLYVVALVAHLTDRRGGGRTTRALWSVGLIVYCGHVVAAFHWIHGWSHRAALLDTARQTQQMVGVASGLGLWLNYLFTLVWTADVLWWWLDARRYRLRPRALSVSVHAFLAFMFWNGAVVFASGFSRWFGVGAALVLAGLWVRRRRLERPPGTSPS